MIVRDCIIFTNLCFELYSNFNISIALHDGALAQAGSSGQLSTFHRLFAAAEASHRGQRTEKGWIVSKWVVFINFEIHVWGSLLEKAFLFFVEKRPIQSAQYSCGNNLSFCFHHMSISKLENSIEWSSFYSLWIFYFLNTDAL